MLNVEDDTPGATKRLFWFIKSICQDSFGVPTQKANGNVTSTPTQKANKCNAHFQSVALKNSSITWTPAKQQVLMRSRPESLRNALWSYPQSWQCCINSNLDEGKAPVDWKSQNVHPIFKKGSKSEPATYHSVALTVILCKQLERWISSCLHSHLDEQSLIKHYQHSFQQIRSCVT